MRAAVVIERSPVPGRCLAVAMLAALSLVGIPRGADAASTGAYYELSNQSSQTGDTYLGPTWVQSSTAQPVDTELQSIGTATVTASAAPGVLRTRVWSVADVESIPSTGVSEFSSAHAAAQFIDRITLGVPSPALIGTTVTVNASFLLNGSLSASYGIEGNNSANFDVLAQTVVQVSGTGITGIVTARESHGN